MLRANFTSVLPPKFREISALCRYGTSVRYRLPVTRETLKPTCIRRMCSVHCSRATSIISSQRLAPAAFSLGIRRLCTPPCHCIWKMKLNIL